MPALVPDPSDRTNALLEMLVLRADNNTLAPAATSQFSPTRSSVAANCLLYASLCCSLVAAVGAMLAKEWLQNYSRTGQAGPLEEQGRFRQQKYTAAQQWHLQSMILFLPNLLLLSVLLFFAALIILLSPINTAVSSVVIAFFGVGIALSGGTVVAGAISPLCPYQTAISRALRRTVGLMLWCWKELTELVTWVIKHPVIVRAGKRVAVAGREWKTKFSSLLQLTRLSNITPVDIDHLSRPSSPSNVESGLVAGGNVWNRHHLLAAPSQFVAHRVFLPIRLTFQWLLGVFNPKTGKLVRTKGEEQHTTNAQALAWLFEMTSSWEDQFIAAKNIRLIDPMACDELLEHPVVWPRLLGLTVEAIRSWRRQKTDQNRVVAEHFAVALYHLLLLQPLDHEKRKQIKLVLPLEMFLSPDIRERSLVHLGHILCGYDLPLLTIYSETFQPSCYVWKVLLHRWLSQPLPFKDERAFVGFNSLRTTFDDATLSLLGLLVSLQSGATATFRSDPEEQKILLILAAQTYMGYVTSLLPALRIASDYSEAKPLTAAWLRLCPFFLGYYFRTVTPCLDDTVQFPLTSPSYGG